MSAELIATVGNQDDIAFFNYTDYEHNALRMMRLGRSGVWRPTPWLALVGEVRSEDLEHPALYAALRARAAVAERARFDIQASDAFRRRSARSAGAPTATDNPVIGYPLAYQYLTSLRTDAVPATADDLLRMRARGWRSSFPVGSHRRRARACRSSARSAGTPGVQVSWKTRAARGGGRGHQRHAVEPTRRRTTTAENRCRAGWRSRRRSGSIIGVSAARGAWLARSVLAPDSAGAARASAPTSSTRGITGSFAARWSGAAGRFRLRSRRRTRRRSTRSDRGSKDATASRRASSSPARADRLGFSLDGCREQSSRCPGMRPVKRIEAGVGYYLQRNLVVRATAPAELARRAAACTNRTYFSGATRVLVLMMPARDLSLRRSWPCAAALIAGGAARRRARPPNGDDSRPRRAAAAVR